MHTQWWIQDFPWGGGGGGRAIGGPPTSNVGILGKNECENERMDPAGGRGGGAHTGGAPGPANDTHSCLSMLIYFLANTESRLTKMSN